MPVTGPASSPTGSWTSRSRSEAFSWRGSDAVLGGQCKAEGVFNLNASFFVGIEGEYRLTDKAKFTDSAFGVPVTVESDLNARTISDVFDYRFLKPDGEGIPNAALFRELNSSRITAVLCSNHSYLQPSNTQDG